MLLQTLYRFSRWLLTRVLNVQCSWESWMSATVHCPMPIYIFFSTLHVGHIQIPKTFTLLNKFTKCKCKTYLVKMSFICTRIKINIMFISVALHLPSLSNSDLGQLRNGLHIYCRVRTVLILKSLNFRESPWKILEFHFSLKSPNKFPCKSLKSPWIFFYFECTVVAWKVFFHAFWLSKTGCESLISCSQFYICYACS